MIFFMRRYHYMENNMNIPNINLNNFYSKMIDIQDKIDCILCDSHTNNAWKINKLHSLLNNTKCDFLVDFDDTISDNKCLLYSKFKYLKKVDSIYKDNLIEDFIINKKFTSFIQDKWNISIIIISANDLSFLKKIIKKNKKNFDSICVKVLWIIWSTEFIKIDLNTKKDVIPIWKKYISDIMEYSKFKWNDNYICLDNYSLLNYVGVICKKICYYLLFIIKNV